MRTRSSRAASTARGVARGGVGAFAVVMTLCAGATCGLLIAAKTSALVKRPPTPVAAIFAGLSLCSSTSRRTAGDRSELSIAAGADAAAATGAGVSSAAFAGADFGASCFGVSCFGAGLAPAAPSSTRAKSAPTSTVSPSAAMISPSLPATGDGTSNVTLSVSSSTIGSSAATASPAFFIQRAIVASLTDSPSVGT